MSRPTTTCPCWDSTQAELEAAAPELLRIYGRHGRVWLNVEPVRERLRLSMLPTGEADWFVDFLRDNTDGRSGTVPVVSWLRIAGDAGRLVCPDLKSGHPEWSRLQLDCQPTDLDFVRDLCRQAESAGVPVWIERLGARPALFMFDQRRRIVSRREVVSLHVTGDGSDPAEWPEDLRRWRQTPGA